MSQRYIKQMKSHTLPIAVIQLHTTLQRTYLASACEHKAYKFDDHKGIVEDRLAGMYILHIAVVRLLPG